MPENEPSGKAEAQGGRTCEQCCKIRPVSFGPTEPARMLSDLQTWLIGAVGRHAGIEFDFVADGFLAKLTEPTGEFLYEGRDSPLAAMRAALRQAKENEQ